jgi:tetratricopeptide (TPR) repeat protein
MAATRTSLTLWDKTRVWMNDGGAWSVHLSWVALFTLAACAFLLLALRLCLVAAFAKRLPPEARWPGAALVSGMAWALAGTATCTYVAIRPDEGFFASLGDSAVAGRQWSMAVSYLQPLADWDTPRADVHHNLGAAYLHLGHFGRALRAFERADALGAERSPDREVMIAAAHEGLGEKAAAVASLRLALSLSARPEQKDAIRFDLARLGAPVAEPK